MENPWLNLEKTDGKYIAECDRGHLTPDLMNDLAVDTLPWPYMGDHEKATVYVLTTSTKANHAREAADGKGRQEVIEKNLAHKHGNDCFPLIALDPRFNGTGLQNWWMDRLSNLIRFPPSMEDVAHSIFIAQYVPYSHHRNRLSRLPSQEYTFSLVRKAMKGGKIIVLMYPYNEWCEAIPELETYSYFCALRYIGVPISNGNIIGKVGFDDIVKAIRKAEGKGESG